MSAPTEQQKATLSECWAQAKAGISFIALLPILIQIATKVLPLIFQMFTKQPKLAQAVAAFDWKGFFGGLDFAKILELVKLIISMFTKIAPKGATAIDWSKFDWNAIWQILQLIVQLFTKTGPTPNPQPEPPGPVAE